MIKLIKLYIRIIITVVLALLIVILFLNYFVASMFIAVLLGSERFYLVGLVLAVILIIGFFIFFLIEKKSPGFINKKKVNNLCIILLITAVMLSIFLRFYIVPPKKVTNLWICGEGQKICDEVGGIGLGYETHWGRKQGDFIEGKKQENDELSEKNNTPINIDMQVFVVGDTESYKIKEGFGFLWEYGIISKKIVLKQRNWELVLRLDIDTSINPHVMTTYFVDASPNFPFDANLFDNVIWVGHAIE